ncbi:MAG: dTDP-4-dehydrorhamnose 3,5-epimerase [Actinomycetota bacterium]
MKIREGAIQGLKVIEPEPIHDDRGFFMRVMSAELLAEAGIDHTRFVQENQSRSRRGVLRGLHFRGEVGEAKLVRCVQGEVFDVAVDLRPGSPTFMRWEGFILDDRRHLQVHIPPGFGHGFQVLSPSADVHYRVDQYYDPSLDAGVAWNDPQVAIDWPLADPILSEKDAGAPTVREMLPQLEAWYGAFG